MKVAGESVILNILATTGGRGGASNSGSVRFEITPAEKRDSRYWLAGACQRMARSNWCDPWR